MANRKTTIAIATILALTIALTVIALPAANAQDKRPTYSFIGANPNPVGVGQEVLLHVGITQQHSGGIGFGWEGLTVTVIKPDGTTQNLGPFKTDSTGGTGTTYTPTEVGNYTLQTHFPEQAYAGITYAASNSEIATLVVQETPIVYYPVSPLPAEYWTRPIDSQLREWSSISGNWLVGRAAGTVAEFVPDNENAPNTAHILWTRQFSEGGLVGGDFGDHAYVTGDAYQGKFANPVIINGVLYYNRYHTGFTASPPQQGIYAVDLNSGEELWFRNNTRLAFGQILHFDGTNMHGALAYLWETSGSTWRAYDPLTGEWVFTFENVPSGTQVYGPNGEILRYNINQGRGWMTMWNSTKAVLDSGPIFISPEFTQNTYAPEGRTIDAATYGMQWNKTVPTGLPGGVRKVFAGDIMVGSTAGTSIGNQMGTNPVVSWGLNLKPGQEGQLLFNTTWVPPSTYLTIKMGAYDPELDVFTLWIKETRTHYGFSLGTGNRLWGPTEPQPYQDSYLWGDWHFTTAYGTYFSAATSGIVYAYDMQTGDLLWTYKATDPYTEALWMPEWGLYTTFLTDGKIYLYHTEHSVVDPKPRGAPFIALNATTGDEIFRIDGLRGSYWGGTALIGDSIIAFHNTYDQRIYAIGKGPSATTVTASPKASVHGSSVVIEGMVTDISAGTDDFNLKKRFPSGVAAVSDESMSEWMKYVYMQFERPMDVAGVEVTLSVLDSNNNYREIGTANTNSDGFFTFSWKPDIEGQYTVYASFAGTEAYWPSHAVTSFVVDEAPPTPAEPEPAAPSAADLYFIPAVAGIIAAIVIVGVVLALLLRKR